MRVRARRCFTVLATLIGAATVPANAQQLFDNWNTAACGFTDTATLTVNRHIQVQRLDIWFRWGRNESAMRYTAARGGRVIAAGELFRAECDPYQEAWCVARVYIGANMKPGTYTFRTQRPGICQNAGSGGQGFIRAYGAGE